MEALTLNDKLMMKIDEHIFYDKIINSCVEKFHTDKKVDGIHKKELFSKCVQSKVKIYDQFYEKNSQNN